jgi:hypothetical protein
LPFAVSLTLMYARPLDLRTYGPKNWPDVSRIVGIAA